MPYKELYSSGIHEQFGKQNWAVIRTYAVTNAMAPGLADALWNTKAGGYPAPYTPRCRRIRRQTNWLPGITKLRAYWRTVRVPGKAKLIIRLGSKPEDAKFDLNGLQLDGPIHTTDATDGLNYATITKGSRQVHRPTAILELQTAYERSTFSARQVAETMAMVGRINKYRLRNFGDFPKGTLKLLGAPTTHLWDEDELWYVNYSFALEPKGWNNLTKRQVVTKLPRKVPVLNTTGTIDAYATPRHVLTEIAQKITSIDADGNVALAQTQEEDTVMFKTTSFKKLDAMVEW